MSTKKPRWPRWIERDEAINLREVAPNLFVGAEYATLHPPEGTKWELVVDWYGSSTQYPSRVRNTSKKLLSLPFLDGDAFPPKALDTLLRRVQAARQRGPVLVHCQAGLSRSASSAYALLRRLSRLPHDEALRRVKVMPGYPRTETLRSARGWAERS